MKKDRIYKYKYNGINSVTKLQQKEIEMLEFWRSFFEKMNDELIGVDKTYSIIETKKLGRIKSNKSLIGNLLGSSREVVESMYHWLGPYYGFIISSNKDNAIQQLESIFQITFEKYFDNEIIRDFLEKLRYEMKTVKNEGFVNSITFKTGRYQKHIKYFKYKPETKKLSLVFELYTKRYDSLFEVLKKTAKSLFVLDYFKNKINNIQAKDIAEFTIMTYKIKDKESNFIYLMKQELFENAIKRINEKKDIEDIEKIKLDIIVKEGEE